MPFDTLLTVLLQNGWGNTAYVLAIAVAAVVGYLLGSINFSIITAKRLEGIDIRTKGSGNAGASNMLRSVGVKGAVITTAGDLLKSVASVLIGFMLMGLEGGLIGGFMAVLGHCFPLYYKFRGGKGVVCSAGMFLMLDWRVFLICIALFIAVVALTKRVSAGSVLGHIALPVAAFLLRPGDIYFLIASLAVMLIVLWAHRSNIKRLLNGTESKMTFKKR